MKRFIKFIVLNEIEMLKQKEMLWMYGILFSLICCLTVSAEMNLTDCLNTTNCTIINNTHIVNQTFIYNYTINQTIFYNITNINLTCINCTYNNNMTNGSFYNKSESDNIYFLKTDFQNWKTIEQPSIYLKKADVNYTGLSELTNTVNQMKNNVTDFNTRLDDNSFTPMWKIIVIITLILCFIAIGISIKVMTS